MRPLLAAILLLPALASAQSYHNTTEWSVVGIYQESEFTGTVGGSSLDIDNTLGLGFSFGYFVTQQLSLAVDLEWLSPDYTATIVNDQAMTSTINHELTQFNGRLKGAYNFTDGPLSPYVEAGFGWTYVDSNVADGPPITGCWWHPWWGYICDGYYDTFDETSFSYGAAVGVRYRVRGGTVLKLSYNNWEVDGSGDAPDPTLNAVRLEVAWGY